MKITGVEAIPLRIPFTHGGPPTGFGGAVWSTIDHLIVRVDTDEGLSGFGEAFGFNVILATKSLLDRNLAPLVIGREAEPIGQLIESAARELHLFGRQGITAFALSGLEIALWDLAGKRGGRPLWELLGGRRRAPLPGYASLLRYGDPAVVERVTAQALEAGFGQVKLHERGADGVRAGRRAAGPGTPLMTDVNCCWSPAEATATARELADVGLVWLEEPVWPPDDFAGLAEVRRAGGVALAAGENASTAAELRRLMAAGAVDYVQPSVTKVGGVGEWLATAAAARELGVKLAPHSPYFGPGLLATLHLAACCPEVEAVESFFLRLDGSPFGDAFDVHAPRLPIPDGPGLGVDPDPRFLERYRIG